MSPNTITYLNGQFLPLGDSAIALVDAGFISGATIVDNARTYDGKPFRWLDHMARFRRDCEACYVPLHATDSELTTIIEELLRRNQPLTPNRELQIVTFATPGPVGLFTGTNNGPPTLGMMTYPVPLTRYRRFFTEGVTLAVVGTQSSLPTDLLPSRIKHRSRLHWHIADQIAKQRDPHSIAVVLNRGIGDTAIGNIIIVTYRGDVLVPPSEHVQESVSVKVLRELTSVQTATVSYDDPEVSELLLLGTGFGIASVSQITWHDRVRTFPWPGKLGLQLIAKWSRLVGMDIVAEFTQ